MFLLNCQWLKPLYRLQHPTFLYFVSPKSYRSPLALQHFHPVAACKHPSAHEYYSGNSWQHVHVSENTATTELQYRKHSTCGDIIPSSAATCPTIDINQVCGTVGGDVARRNIATDFQLIYRHLLVLHSQINAIKIMLALKIIEAIKEAQYLEVAIKCVCACQFPYSFLYTSAKGKRNRYSNIV